jgi:hypothetical protein
VSGRPPYKEDHFPAVTTATSSSPLHISLVKHSHRMPPASQGCSEAWRSHTQCPVTVQPHLPSPGCPPLCLMLHRVLSKLPSTCTEGKLGLWQHGDVAKVTQLCGEWLSLKPSSL